MASELKSRFAIMHNGPMLLLKKLLSIVSKIKILGWNNKTVVWSAACPISDLFSKGKPILGSADAPPNFGSPLPNTSDIGQQPTK